MGNEPPVLLDYRSYGSERKTGRKVAQKRVWAGDISATRGVDLSTQTSHRCLWLAVSGRAESVSRHRRSSRLPPHLQRGRVFSKRDQPRVTQMFVRCPLDVFKPSHEHRFHPMTILHFVSREALAPPPAPCFRQVRERTLSDLKILELLVELLPQ